MALGNQDAIVAHGGGHLQRGMLDVLRRHKLPLLEVHHAAGAARFEQDVGLAGRGMPWNLQNIRGFGGQGAACAGLMDVGQHGEPRVANALQDAQAFLEAGAAIGDRRLSDWLCRKTP